MSNAPSNFHRLVLVLKMVVTISSCPNPSQSTSMIVFILCQWWVAKTSSWPSDNVRCCCCLMLSLLSEKQILMHLKSRRLRIKILFPNIVLGLDCPCSLLCMWTSMTFLWNEATHGTWHVQQRGHACAHVTGKPKDKSTAAVILQWTWCSTHVHLNPMWEWLHGKHHQFHLWAWNLFAVLFHHADHAHNDKSALFQACPVPLILTNDVAVDG